MTDELNLLQALRLKGRVSVEGLAVALGVGGETVSADLDGAISEGLVALVSGRYRLSEAGRDRVAELVAAERSSLDQAVLEGLYAEFDGYNGELKSIVTAWQMRAPDVPNDHTDAAYDAAIIDRLMNLHQRFLPWLNRLAQNVPRLSGYRNRFDTAARNVQAGDHSFVARPIMDSYHTVWFELHEVLIGALGRDRASEAAAGRAG